MTFKGDGLQLLISNGPMAEAHHQPRTPQDVRQEFYSAMRFYALL
jgi:hypothetical protein